MMRYLTSEQVYRLQKRALAEKGGMPGVRDAGAVESAVAQPQMTFGGEDLYPTLAEKAAALAFSLIKNHAFADANKRVGHAAMETLFSPSRAVRWSARSSRNGSKGTSLRGPDNDRSANGFPERRRMAIRAASA